MRLAPEVHGIGEARPSRWRSSCRSPPGSRPGRPPRARRAAAPEASAEALRRKGSRSRARCSLRRSSAASRSHRPPARPAPRRPPRHPPHGAPVTRVDPHPPRHVDPAPLVAQLGPAFGRGLLHHRPIQQGGGPAQLGLEPVAFTRHVAELAARQRQPLAIRRLPVDHEQRHRRPVPAPGREVRARGSHRWSARPVTSSVEASKSVRHADRRRQHPRRRAIDEPADHQVPVMGGEAQATPSRRSSRQQKASVVSARSREGIDLL